MSRSSCSQPRKAGADINGQMGMIQGRAHPGRRRIIFGTHDEFRRGPGPLSQSRAVDKGPCRW